MKLHLPKLSRPKQLLLAPLLVSLLLLAAALGNPRPLDISTEFEGATIQISADKSWSLFPGDCLEIDWQVEGIESIYIDGQGKIGWGELDYCPSFDAASPDFLITTQNGAVRAFTLDTYFLPSEIVNCLLFVLILSLFALALWYFWTLRLDEPPPVKPNMLLVIAVAWALCLLATAVGAFSVRQILGVARGVFFSNGWQYFGIVIAALVYVPLLIQSVLRGIKTRASADFIAIAGFLAFLLLLHLPFGFETVAQWEGWVNKADLEGSPSAVMTGELVTRFWVMLPYTLANVVSPHSFVGHHIFNVVMFWSKLALFYGILRRLSVAPLFAFLCSMIFIVYPVNPFLMSLRSYTHTFNVLSLFAAFFFTLEFLRNPGRLRLAALLLAMFFTVGSYDAAYALVCVAPVLWWRRFRSSKWIIFNTTIIWYLALAAKVLYVLLLLSANLSFRGTDLTGHVGIALLDGRSLPFLAAHYADILKNVYLQTFVFGWQDAVSAISQNTWIVPAIAMLTVTGLLALWLAREDCEAFPSRRQLRFAVLSGLLLRLPSVGVMMWLERYNRDLWRMYILVPIGAAVALLSIVLLVSSMVRQMRMRTVVTVLLCLFFMFPAISRLFVQKTYFENMADNKVQVLRQVTELAPRFAPDTLVILLTEMGLRELGDNHIYDFRRATFNASMWILYQDQRPSYSVLCWDGRMCNSSDWGDEDFDIRDIVTDASQLVLMRLHEDLTVELLRELPPELGLDDRGSYNPDRLIDYAAPPPPRAVSMLGATARGN